LRAVRTLDHHVGVRNRGGRSQVLNCIQPDKARRLRIEVCIGPAEEGLRDALTLGIDRRRRSRWLGRLDIDARLRRYEARRINFLPERVCLDSVGVVKIFPTLAITLLR